MIKVNIWVVFSLYLIYAIFSIPIFFKTSGGWMAIFYYLIFVGLYYVVTSVLLFLSALLRTARKRTKVTINAALFLRLIPLQSFVILFNYAPCDDTLCAQGFLPTILEEMSIPIFLSPPFVIVLLALILYLVLLSFFLLDLH